MFRSIVEVSIREYEKMRYPKTGKEEIYRTIWPLFNTQSKNFVN